MADVEHQVQKAICDYLDLHNICYWAVPNGGSRNLRTGTKLKREGVKPGVPDLTIVHSGRYIGLEVKKPKTNSPKGRLSKAQKKFHKKIEAAGGHVEVVYSLEDVIEVINRLMISVDKEYKFIEDQWWAKV